MSKLDRFNSFCMHYCIKVLDASKRCAKTISPTFFPDPKDKDKYDIATLEIEPLLTIQIPESKLQQLYEVESIFYNNISGTDQRRIFETWIQQQREEKQLRKDNPTVQAAYEQYSMVLNLVKQNHNKLKDLDND